VPKTRVLLAETESRVARDPAAVQPAPVHHDLAIVLVQVRDEEEADLALYDRTPEEDCFPCKEFAEDRNTLCLDGEPTLQVEAGFECISFLELGVDRVSSYRSPLLPFMEPLLDCDVESVFGRARAFELGVQELLHPVGVARFDRAIDTDQEVERRSGFGFRLCFCQHEFVSKKPLGSANAPELIEYSFYAHIFEIHVVFHNTLLPLIAGIVLSSTRQEADKRLVKGRY
jgi:hypothetical protein